MVIMLVLKWWYGAGWMWAWKRAVNERIEWVNQAFSIKDMIRTWFSPFKQTYSNTNKGSIDMRVQASIDNFVSRLIGSLLRTIIIFVGFLGIILALASGILIMVIWPLVPWFPIIAILFSIFGVGV